MNKQELFEMGKRHAEAGKQCTPFDCQEIDANLFAESKKVARPFEWYSEMRGAFNAGWQEKYWEMVK